MKKLLIIAGFLGVVGFSVSTKSAQPVAEELQIADADLLSAAMDDDVERLEQLLNAGANVDYARNGETALMTAALFGSLNAVKFLLTRGATVDLKDRAGMTALDAAIMASVSTQAVKPYPSEIVAILLLHRAHVTPEQVELAQDNEHIRALLEAAIGGFDHLVQFLQNTPGYEKEREYADTMLKEQSRREKEEANVESERKLEEKKQTGAELYQKEITPSPSQESAFLQ